MREAIALLPSPAAGPGLSHPVVSVALGQSMLRGRGNRKIGIKPRSTWKISPVLPKPLRVRFAGEDRGAHPPELGMPVGVPALLPHVPVSHGAVTTGSSPVPGLPAMGILPWGQDGSQEDTHCIPFSPENTLRNLLGSLLGGDVVRRV